MAMMKMVYPMARGNRELQHREPQMVNVYQWLWSVNECNVNQPQHTRIGEENIRSNKSNNPISLNHIKSYSINPH
jgi:hypothetical protein